MSCWDILGIASTDGKRAIKRAYAMALALHHPEDDPSGAQRVQEAYEEALAHACGEGVSSEVLDAAFPPMGDARGRAACTAVASDGTVYTALVEYGTDGAVTELVMAEAA